MCSVDTVYVVACFPYDKIESTPDGLTKSDDKNCTCLLQNDELFLFSCGRLYGSSSTMVPSKTRPDTQQSSRGQLGRSNNAKTAWNSTRPDTRPTVADGWAGVEMQLSATKNVLKRSFPHFSTHVHGPTDRPTDGRTKPLIELRVRN